MRTVDFFFIVFGTSLTSVYVHSKPTHSYSTLLLPNDVMRVKKRHEDSSTGYLEQCGIVKFPKAQQGVVNVLAFLDSSWPYSHRQAIMLKMLNERLRRSGLPDTLFFVVNVDPSYARTVDNAEDDIEREAWLGVSPDEIETFASIVKTTDSLAMSMTPDIQLIQDNQDLQIWKELRGSRDQVLVIDRCGKLTYQVIVPWSILHFPYVKAAILSTYKDEPCGPCDAIHSTRDPIKPNDDVTILDAKMESISTTEEYFQNDREGHAPTKSDSIENGSVLESSTIDSIQLGSPHNYLMSKGIDVAEETTTSSNIFNETENYTGMNSDTENEAELTTLTSTTYITAADLTKIEIDSTTPIKTDTTDSTNTMTENFNSQTPVFEVNEKSVQNTDQPESVTISTSLINTDSTYSVSYYDTTANIYTKGNEDTTTQKTLESDSTKLFSIDEKSATLQNEEIQSLVEKYDTTTKKIVSSNTESVIPVEEKSNKRKNSENLEDRLDENSEEIQSAVEKYDSTTFINSYVDNVADLAASTNFMADTTTKKIVSSNTESVIRVEEKSNKSKNSENLEDRLEENNEDIQSSVEKYDSTTFINSNVDNVADLAASTNFMADTTTKKIVSSNTESVIRVEDKSNKSKNSENLEDRLDENREEIQSSVEKYDSTTFINSDVDDVADLAASTNFIADTTTKKIVSSNTERVIRVEEKSNKSKNSENLEHRLDENSEEIQSSVQKYDSTTFINSNVDNVADLAASTNFMADTTTKKILSSNTESVIRVEEKSNKSKNSEKLEDRLKENSEEIQSSVEKYDSTTFINSDVDNVADLAASTNFMADTTTKIIVSSNTESVFRFEEKSNKRKNSENLEDRLDENSEEIQSSVEKYDSTTFINSYVDDVADLAASTNFMADTTTKKIVSLNTESVEKKSNKSKNSENLEDRLDENSETEDTSQLSDMPLRIIMHAPHFHIDGDSTRMHEYLVLKTGSSDYHRHLASYDATRLYRGPQDFQETLEYIRNPEIESKKWPMTNVIYNRDESPGLYGEVADYWKNSGGQDNYDYTEETENPGVEENTEEPNVDDEISKKPAKADDTNFSERVGILAGESTISNGGIEKTAGITESWQADFENESITENQALNDEVTNVEEEETRSKLIAHYSKLLPWIYYVLDK